MDSKLKHRDTSPPTSQTREMATMTIDATQIRDIKEGALQSLAAVMGLSPEFIENAIATALKDSGSAEEGARVLDASPKGKGKGKGKTQKKSKKNGNKYSDASKKISALLKEGKDQADKEAVMKNVLESMEITPENENYDSLIEECVGVLDENTFKVARQMVVSAVWKVIKKASPSDGSSASSVASAAAPSEHSESESESE